jgi:hypothetical protein
MCAPASVRPCAQRLELHVVADGNAREPLVLSVTLVTVRTGDGGVEGADGGVEECCDPYATADPSYQVFRCRGFPQPSPICLSTPLAPPPSSSTRTRAVFLALLAGLGFSTQQLTRLSPPRHNPCARMPTCARASPPARPPARFRVHTQVESVFVGRKPALVETSLPAPRPAGGGIGGGGGGVRAPTSTDDPWEEWPRPLRH